MNLMTEYRGKPTCVIRPVVFIRDLIYFDPSLIRIYKWRRTRQEMEIIRLRYIILSTQIKSPHQDLQMKVSFKGVERNCVEAVMMVFLIKPSFILTYPSWLSCNQIALKQNPEISDLKCSKVSLRAKNKFSPTVKGFWRIWHKFGQE